MAGREGCKFFSRRLKNLVIRYWLFVNGYLLLAAGFLLLAEPVTSSQETELSIW